MQTYSNKSNAKRAAVKALISNGIAKPVVEKDFVVEPVGERFAWNTVAIAKAIKTPNAQITCNSKVIATVASTTTKKPAKAGIMGLIAQFKANDKDSETPKQVIEKNRASSNGITARSTGTLCQQVWKQCDTLAKEAIPAIKDLIKWAEETGANVNNAKIEYYEWRKFHGISGRVKAGTTMEQYKAEKEA